MSIFSSATRFSFNRIGALCAAAILAIGLSGCAAKSDHSARRLTHSGPATPRVQELRGVWVTNVDSDVLLSRDSIAEMMDFLAANNFNVVYPVVWNKAYTMYPSEVMERHFGRRIDPVYGDRDPLAELIVEAHRVGIEVIPWFEFGFATSYNIGGGPILEQRPHWAALDIDGNLAKKNNFEWMNAFDPEVQAFLTELVVEVARNYDVDGIQGDDRLPALPSLAGYDPHTVSLWRAAKGTEPPADEKDPDWVQFRADLLTDYLVRLRDAVHEVDPNLIVSSSPTPSLGEWGLVEYLQDSTRWINERIVDTVHPQLYRREFERYTVMVDDLVAKHTPEQLEIVIPGVLMKAGPWVIDEDYMLNAVRYNREKGFPGEVWFFYEGLRANDDALGLALGAGPYAEPAALTYRQGLAWRPGGIISRSLDAAATGAWQVTPQVDNFRQLRGSLEGGTVTYSFDIPADGVYDLYVNHRGGPNHTRAAEYVDPRTGSLLATLDQSDPALRGWVRIGTVNARRGNGQPLLRLEANEPSTNRVTFAGDAMLLINRRQSPRAVFADFIPAP